jgi:peptide deformylase
MTKKINSKNISLILNKQTPTLENFDNSDYASNLLLEKKDMIEAFLRFCHNKKNALAIAANQVSYSGERISDRFFAIRDFDELKNWKLIINPIIKSLSGEPEKVIEKCLTWPGKEIHAERYPSIVVSYYNINEQEIENIVIEGFEAHVWQHEIDHLNGVEETLISKTITRNSPKLGRNDLCNCGSGKKYKKCCMA